MPHVAWTRACILLLVSVLPTALGQTFTDCSPLEKTCPANPAMGQSLNTDFTKVSGLPSGWAMTSGALTYDSTGAKFTVAKQGDAPTVQTSDYFFFGYCEVTMKASGGQGIVSSIVLESDDLDEVDWEMVGANTAQVQTNYFGKGDTSTYDRAIWHPIATPQNTFHTYAVNWTSSSLSWLVDGVVIRTLKYADAKAGTRYPQTPMRLKLGIWAGGDSNNANGTIEWAGGKTDYSQAPFTMTVQSVKVVNYSPATSYSYGDLSGSWQSIKVAGGIANVDSGSDEGSAAASTTTLFTRTDGTLTTLATSTANASVASGSAVFEISTATEALTTSTAGRITTSVPGILPLLGSTTFVEGTANATHTSSTAKSTTDTVQNTSQAFSVDVSTSLRNYFQLAIASLLWIVF